MPAIAILFAASANWKKAVAQRPAAKAPVIPEADGYVEIPHAAVSPGKAKMYKANF
jgi:hypothetical protein